MKDFLILGSNIGFKYKEVFPSIFKGIVNCTHIKTIEFINNEKPVGIRWYTTLKLSEPPYMELTEKYTPEKYPKFDNYDAINVNKSKDIPCDYYGAMGVPVSFFSKLNRQQFDLIGLWGEFKECDYNNGLICGEVMEIMKNNIKPIYWRGATLNKRKIFSRLIIKRKI